MKQILKKILPQSVINHARDYQNKKQLANVARLNFDVSILKTKTDYNLPAIFSDPFIERSWSIDCADIEQCIGDTDKLGGVNPGDRRALYYLISALKPENVLEIGTHIGASTLYIASALQVIGAGRVTTVDIKDVNAENGPWKDIGLRRSPVQNMKELGIENRVTFKSFSSVSYMLSTRDRYDFIFLDGDHSTNTVYHEIHAALQILNEGGTILLHDYYPDGKALFPDGNIIHGPLRAIEHIKEINEQIDILPLGDLPWPTKQGSHKTSLALLIKRT